MEYTKEELKNKGIYKINNIVNGKFYIGSTYSKGGFKKRWSEHIGLLIKNKHHSKHLQNAWNKYGKESFIFEILETIDNITLIIPREQYYLDLLESYNAKNGYNICPKANSMAGRPCSKETRIKLSLANKNKIVSEETRIKISISRLGDDNPSAKLNNKQVEEIRKQYCIGDISQEDLGNHYGIHPSGISNIVNNKTYKSKGFTPIKIKIVRKKNNTDYVGKLSMEQANDIRWLYNNSKTSSLKLAKQYDVTKPTILHIIHNRTYIDINYKPPIMGLIKTKRITRNSQIINEYKNNKTTYKKMSEKYAVSLSQLYIIINNKTYKRK